jgi:hypothetical protein
MVLSLLSDAEKVDRAYRLIREMWEELGTLPEEMESRQHGIGMFFFFFPSLSSLSSLLLFIFVFSFFKLISYVTFFVFLFFWYLSPTAEESLRSPTTNNVVLLSELRAYYSMLTSNAKWRRSIDAVVAALQVVHHTCISEGMTDPETLACYAAVWRECLRCDVEVLVSIQETDEVRESKEWDELLEESVLAHSVREWKEWLERRNVRGDVEKWSLTTSMLNQAYVELGTEMVEFGAESGMLPTLQKVCSQWSE